MKKFLFVFLSLVLVCCCCSALANSLNASWSDGKLTVSASFSASPAAVKLSGDGIGGNTQLNTNSSSITVNFPADNQWHTVRCSPFPNLTGFSDTATFYAGVLHTHDYTADVTPPTCTVKGYTTYTCSCGDSYVDNYVDALGHDIKPDAAVAPTCTETGLTAGEHCTRCDYKVAQEVVAALGHNIVKDEAKAATCTEPGLTAGEHCTRCDYKVAQEVVPALGHDIVKDEAVAATCTETGLTEGEHCTRCDYKVAQEVVAALGHNIVKDAAVDPTCTKIGLTEGEHCTRCDYKVTQEVIAALGHDIVVDEAVAPTCTETGLTAGEHCSRCDYKVAQEVVPALGHDIVVDEAVAPTCTESGLTAGEHCTRCDYKVAQEEIPALGHKYVEFTRDQRYIVYKCTVCGAMLTVENNNPILNLYGSILLDANMENVDYTSYIDSEDSKMLVIDAVLSNRGGKTTEIGLYLTDSLIKTFTVAGYTSVKYVNGSAVLVIRLADITNNWFDTAEKITHIAFVSAPQNVQSVIVKVNAQLANKEFVPANAFTGVILKGTNEDIAVTQNGQYTLN